MRRDGLASLDRAIVLAEGRRLFADLFEAFVASIEPIVHRLAPGRRRVVVLEAGALVLYEGSGRQAPARRGLVGADAQAMSGCTSAVELRLPADHFLRRTLSLPAAGRDYLRQILDHRLERLTPWRPDRVVYGFKAQADEPTAGTIGVDFLATSADRLAPILDRLSAAGLVASRLGSAEDPLDAPPRIDLYEARARGADARLRRVAKGALLAAFLGLTAACAATAWLASRAEDDRAEAAGRLAALRTRIQAGQGAAPSRDGALIEAHRDGSILTLLDQLSAAVPDHTVLREVNLAARKVRLVGRSGNAPALIAQLEGQAGLSGVRFGAPVVRDADGRDLFEVVAERQGAPRVASAPDGPPSPRRPQ